MHPMVISFYLYGAIFGYLFGSIPFGLILSKLFGYGDIRKTGSGNIGATNVLRTGNKSLALATLFFDAIKGYIPMFLIAYTSMSLFLLPPIAALYIGAWAIVGHCFPVWLKFKGGKGVATAFGVLVVSVPYAAIVGGIAWLASLLVSRISSLSALIASGVVPIVTFFIYGGAPAVVCLLIALLVFWRHKENIQRLMKGEEPKIGQKN